MSFSAAQDQKEQVRAATDIVALVGSERTVDKKGRDYYALCPFHDDHKPSMVLNQQRQTWRCWTCGEGGDVFSYVMKRESLDFRGALEVLAANAGIELRGTGQKTKLGSPNDKATLFKAMAWAETQFHRFLLEAAEAAPAREYLKERQINQQSIERYRIGYAPKEWNWLLTRAKATSFSPEVLEAVGLAKINERGHAFDFFRGRVMFPIRDTQERPIAVGGRILPMYADDQAAKYYNSAETMLYSKSRQLYGLSTCKDDLDQLRREQKKRNVVVMEGYTDVVVSRQAGVANPVAVCGTALTEHHVTLVSRFADQLTLMFDGDKAGTDKAKKLIELYLGSTIELRVATPPGGLDPCDFVLQHGAAEFEKLVANSVDALDFSMDEELKGIDVVNDSIATSKACGRIIGMLAQPQAATSRNPEFRVQFQLVARRIARRFRLEEATVKEQLSSRVFGDSMRVAAKEDEPVAASHAKLHGWEVGLFTLLIQDPDAISAVIENVGELDMRTETGRNLLIIYQDLEAEGRTPDFETVMASIEDSGIKAVLVELVEEADRKQGDDTELQLRELMGAFNGRRDKKERRHERAELESGKLSEQEELELLRKLFPPTSS